VLLQFANAIAGEPQTPSHIPPVLYAESIVGLAEDPDAIDPVYDQVRIGLISSDFDLGLIFTSESICRFPLLDNIGLRDIEHIRSVFGRLQVSTWADLRNGTLPKHRHTRFCTLSRGGRILLD
jgi:hypothetical protein